MTTSTRVVVLLLGAGWAVGCATRAATPLRAASAEHGKAPRDRGDSSAAAGSPLREYMATIRHLSARPVVRESAASNAESADPQLAAALAVAAADASAENELRVAHEYLRLGILDTAYTRANRALLRNPHLAEAHEMLARIWRDWGLPHLGLGAAVRAIYYDPRSSPAENTLGTLLDAMGQPAEARLAFSRALTLDHRAGWAMNNLCFVELRLGLLAEARAHCEAALGLDPRLTAAANNLALTFVAAGDPAAAGQAFLAAGNPANAAYNRGIIHLASREYLPAAEAFEEAIAARPGFTAAKTRAHEARMLILTVPRP